MLSGFLGVGKTTPLEIGKLARENRFDYLMETTFMVISINTTSTRTTMKKCYSFPQNALRAGRFWWA